LGDRLPGAFQIAARAAKMTVEDYTKAVSEGKIGSDQVIAIARELGKTYGAAEAGTAGLLEAQARFENAANRFRTNIAAGGFVESFQNLLTKLTEMMNNGQADKLAAQLSAGFSTVIDVLGSVADHIDAIKFAVAALIGLNLVKWLLSLPTLFVALRTELALANTHMTAFQATLVRQEAAAAAARALGATGLTGVVANLTPVITNAGKAVLAFYRLLPYIGLAVVAIEGLSFALDKLEERKNDTVANAIDAATRATRDAFKARQEYEKTIGTDNEAKFKAQYERFRDIAVAAAKAEGVAVAKARADGVNMSGHAVESALSRRRAAEAAQAGVSGATPDPGNPDGSRQRAAQLKKKLDAEDAKNERQSRLARLKGEKGDLAERLEIIREPFDEMKKNYREATKDDEEYQKAVKAIDASYARAAAVERQRYANEQAKSGESEAKKRLNLAKEIEMDLAKVEDDVKKRAFEADPTEPFEERRKARVKDIGHAYDELAKKIIREKALNPEQAAKDQQKLDLLTKQREELENQNAYRDEANRLLDEFNKKQGVLNTNVTAIKAEADAGVISQAAATEQINEQIKLLGPGIQDAGNAALEFSAMAANMLDPVRFAEIVATVRQGMARSSVDSQVALNGLADAQRQLNELSAQQAREIDAINLKRKLGIIDSNEEVDAINATTMKYAASFQSLGQNLLGFIAVVKEKGGMAPEQLAALDAAANALVAKSKAGIVVAKEWETTLVGSVATNGVNAFDKMAESMGKVITGQQGISEGFHGMLQAAGMFFASLLKDIAMAILRMQILKMLQGLGGGIGAAAGAALPAAPAPVAHEGGVIGATTRSRSNTPLSAFLGAVRYHTGGIAGFAPNEVPAVLMKGEEVLTRDDPRNILNGGGARQAGDGNGTTAQRFVLVDDRKGVAEAMASSAGEKVTLVHLKNNLPTIKQWMRNL
jgi:hypothetical protein